jgi:hypothetical protein
MRTSSNYALRLPTSLKRAVEEVAREGWDNSEPIHRERGGGKTRRSQDGGLLCRARQAR